MRRTMRRPVLFSTLLSLAILAAPASAQEQIIRLEPEGDRLSESAAGWREVRRWSGSADRTTPPFAILGQNWRIRWQVCGCINLLQNQKFGVQPYQNSQLCV